MIRWSQIMYMYYFLGYQLKGDSSLKTEEEKRQRANNTFLLALDGDVDFQPDAIVKVSSKKAEEKFIQSSGCRPDEKKPKDRGCLWQDPSNWQWVRNTCDNIENKVSTR